MLFEFSEIWVALAFLVLRIVIGYEFLMSGWLHVTQVEERAKSLGFSEGFTSFVGVVEIIGALSIMLGFYIQLGAIVLIAVMIGAIYLKLFVWKTPYFADQGFGWNYDAILLAANLVFLFAGGGMLVLM